MTRLILVRHAATVWSGMRFGGQTDLPLSEEGRAQLPALCADLSCLGLVDPLLVSSPRLRALETARSLSDAFDATLRLDARLAEADFGLAEGHSFAQIAARWPSIASALGLGALAIDWPSGESASAFVTRIRGVARELAAADRDVIAVTHGGVARIVLSDAGMRVSTLCPGAFIVIGQREPIATPPFPHELRS